MRNIGIRSFLFCVFYSAACFPVFGINTEIFFVFSRIQTRKTPNSEIFYAVIVIVECKQVFAHRKKQYTKLPPLSAVIQPCTYGKSLVEEMSQFSRLPLFWTLYNDFLESSENRGVLGTTLPTAYWLSKH